VKIYKYTTKEHAVRLARYGSFRIGTLYEYRSTEHRGGIADPEEGTKTIQGTITEYFASGSDIPTNLADLGIIKVDGASSNITLNDFSFRSSVSSGDAYIWCGSLENSLDVQRQFEGAESCVEIFNAKGFFDTLDALMRDAYNVRYKGLHIVAYKERQEEWQREGLGVHPGLIKAPAFGGQKEIRAIWEPIPGTTIAPITGQNKRLADCCRLVRVRR